jgi:hypothetical protein
MSQQATNDPNYFLNEGAVGTFNDTSQDESGYGILAAAEQNQTYFVYSNGVTSAEPEFIDQSLYNIKYLIDEQGNVYKPNSSGIVLNNLKNNFFNRPMVVESQTPTQVLANMLGEQTLNDIGSIQPLIFSENGTNRNNFETSMSFGLYGSTIISSSVNLNNIVANAVNGGSMTSLLQFGGRGNMFYFKDGSQNIGTQTIDLNSTIFPPGNDANQLNPSAIYGEYTFAVDSLDYGADVSFFFRWEVMNQSPAYFPGGILLKGGGAFPYVNVNVAIQKSDDGGSTWSNLPLLNTSYFNNNNDVVVGNVSPTTYLYGLDMSRGAKGFDPDATIQIQTLPQYYGIGVKIRVQMYYSVFALAGGTPFGYTDTTNILYNNGFRFKALTNYSADLITTSSYWDGSNWPTDGVTPQWITSSVGLSGFMFKDPAYVYNPTSSLLNTTPTGYGFNKPLLPLNPQPGDYIRFEYDKNKTSRIYDVKTITDGTNRIALRIYPTIPSGSQLDHFVIVRLVDDGGSFLSPVKKVNDGTFTSFIKPKYTTQTLNDNLPTIINTLEKDGLLTTLT